MATLKIPSELHTQSDMPHGVYHLANHPELFEIARNNNFEFLVDFKDQPLIRQGMATTDTGATITNAQELLRLSTDGSSVPHFSQKPIQIKRGNNTLNYAGTPEWSGHTIKVIDFLGVEAKEILMAWQALSYDIRTEKVGLVSDYKKTASLLEYSPDYQLIRRWKLFGCWVSEIREDEFRSDADGKREITATIIYDKAEIDRSSTL